MSTSKEQLDWWREWYYYAALYIADQHPHTIASLAHRYADGVAHVIVATEQLESYQEALQGAVDAGIVSPAHKSIVGKLAFEVARVVAKA